MSNLLWKPASPENTRIAKLQKQFGFENYWDLYEWSINDLDQFWSTAWDDLGILGEKGGVVYQEGEDFISAKFFPEARLNVAKNLLANGDANAAAIISIAENKERREITWNELRELVAATAAAFRAEGVEKGDRVVVWSSNLPEVAIWALAALSIGAIVSTASPDFAPKAVKDRFGQIEPKLLLVCDSYSYGGKNFILDSKIAEIEKLLPTVQKVIRISGFNDFIAPFNGSDLVFTELPFDHPGFVLFSSGTTGQPKCILHSAAGVLLKTGSEIFYHNEIQKSERILFFTTCGWMMWDWLLNVLITGATIVLYDGSPVYPRTERLIDIAESESLNYLGVSAKYIDTLNKAEIEPKLSHNLSNLRMIASTGSTLSSVSFDYVYRSIKWDLHLASMSGGTDICGCFMAGIPALPVYSGELQGPCLGMAITVFDTAGEIAEPGIKGELVCLKPFPSKPIGFWGDHNFEKYRAAYFEGYPGVWTHGDFAARTDNGGFIIYGRSDATLNSKGVRIGTAEIYSVVETFADIQESMAIAQEWDGDSRVILFVVPKKGRTFTEENAEAIKLALRQQASPRHVPDKIVIAPGLPRTKSNKLVELAVTDVINGREVRNRDSLENPDILDWFAHVKF